MSFKSSFFFDNCNNFSPFWQISTIPLILFFLQFLQFWQCWQILQFVTMLKILICFYNFDNFYNFCKLSLAHLLGPWQSGSSQHYRVTWETCDLRDIWSEWWVDMTWQFWQFIVYNVYGFSHVTPSELWHLKVSQVNTFDT